MKRNENQRNNGMSEVNGIVLWLNGSGIEWVMALAPSCSVSIPLQRSSSLLFRCSLLAHAAHKWRKRGNPTLTLSSLWEWPAKNIITLFDFFLICLLIKGLMREKKSMRADGIQTYNPLPVNSNSLNLIEGPAAQIILFFISSTKNKMNFIFNWFNKEKLDLLWWID